LHDSIFITFDNWAGEILFDPGITFVRNILELHRELKAFIFSLLPLDTHDFFDRRSDVEFFNIFPKLARFNLG
jgi:hypothetical protein